jgi:hypothetical protein
MTVQKRKRMLLSGISGIVASLACFCVWLMLTNFGSDISGFPLCHFVWAAMLLLFVCGSTPTTTSKQQHIFKAEFQALRL